MMVVITLLCISFSLLQTPACTTATLRIQYQVQQSQEKVNNEVHDDPLSLLPRKLMRFTDEVTVMQHGGEDTMTHNNKLKEEVPAAGTSLFNNDQGLMRGIGNKKKGVRVGTWQQWLEGGETSQYFTMDYSQVKRRQPIHNKSLPVAP